MTKKWPAFVTKDLGDGPGDDAEMMRRWQAYNDEMQPIIASGIAHQDDDGWWVETATGELIGPDPELERPSSDEQLAGAKPFSAALPDLAASIRRSRGRPKVDARREQISIRLDPDVIEKFKAGGPGWQTRMNNFLRYADHIEEALAELKEALSPVENSRVRVSSSSHAGDVVDKTSDRVEILRRRIVDYENLMRSIRSGEIAAKKRA